MSIDRSTDNPRRPGYGDDRGWALDSVSLLGRRRALSLLGGVTLGALVGCGSSGSDSAGSTTTGSSTSTGGSASTSAAGACAVVPEETAGPYPGDGTNGPNVLSEDGVVRSDIRSSFGSSTTTAEGVPLRIELTITDAANSCAPFAGAAVYLWHCDRDGQYSLYGQGITGESYLRGVQEADSAGKVTFTTIFPAAYSGRWPHAHFEVYETLADATGGGRPRATSQLAFPEATCDLVYATDGYEQSVTNLARTSLATDMVFSDGATQETPAVAGSVADGFVATLTVPV